jgi:hypothetical protein
MPKYPGMGKNQLLTTFVWCSLTDIYVNGIKIVLAKAIAITVMMD